MREDTLVGERRDAVLHGNTAVRTLPTVPDPTPDFSPPRDTKPPWRTVAPEIFDRFDAITATALTAIDAGVTGPIIRMIDAVLGCSTHGRGVTPTDARELACLAFAEQFVVDVSAITDAQRAAMTTAMGNNAFLFVQSVYVNDVFTRARLGLARLFGTVTPPVTSEAIAPELLWPELERFMASVARLDRLDPLLTELIRLHGARVHECRLCRSRVSVKALDLAGDLAVLRTSVHESRTAFTDRQRVALRLTDALVTQPSSIDDTLARHVHEHFDAAEVVEIVLDVARNAANKIAVAFGADAPNVTEGVEYFDLDGAGEVIADVDAEVVRAGTARTR